MLTLKFGINDMVFFYGLYITGLVEPIQEIYMALLVREGGGETPTPYGLLRERHHHRAHDLPPAKV